MLSVIVIIFWPSWCILSLNRTSIKFKSDWMSLELHGSKNTIWLMGDKFYSLLSITAIPYSLIIDTLMILWSLVTLSAPLFCCMTQMYVPLPTSWTGLMCRLPLESWMNLLRSTSIPPCLLHLICGLGVPSELQWIIPRVPAITFCRDLVLSVNLAVERKEIT